MWLLCVMCDGWFVTSDVRVVVSYDVSAVAHLALLKLVNSQGMLQLVNGSKLSKMDEHCLRRICKILYAGQININTKKNNQNTPRLFLAATVHNPF